MSSEKKDILSRVYLVYVIIVVFALVIIGQTFNVQIVQGAQWKEKAENLTVFFNSIEAVRGNIYAADGSLLATSVPKYEVRFDANTPSVTDDFFYEKADSLAQKLSELYPEKSKKKYLNELVEARKRGARYHLIRRNVKFTDLKKMETFPIFRKGKYKGGFIYTQQNKRVKPFNILAERTIGYDREDIQPVGIEGAYSKELKGINGKRLEQKIAGGIWMPISDENEIEPVDGSDVYSTIDVNIQDVAENALLKQLQLHHAGYGCVAVMEVATGEIKAIANLQMHKDSNYYESYNFIVGAATEPGSTFKLASLMAAFEDGYLTLEDRVDTEDGTTKFYDAVMRDSHKGGYGKISIKDAFIKSSNVAISKEINRVYTKSPQKFIDRLNKMYVNKKLDIEISGEGTPKIKNTTDKTWSGITLPWMSIGYEVELTPLNILTFYNAIANNGKMVKPKFVKEIRHRGKLVKTIETEVLNSSICSQQTIAMAKEMLEGVVEEGTAQNLKNNTYKIAGKTGTAQIANKKLGYKYKGDVKVSYQASFVGYFPADNPKYTCIVVVNAPSKGVYYGNLVAGPIFKEVADKVYATSIDIHKAINKTENLALSRIPYAKDGKYSDLKTVYNQFEIKTTENNAINEWAKISTTPTEAIISSKKIAPIYVADVVGMSIKDAIFILENQGLYVHFQGRGTVKNQSILPGSKIIKGEKITLTLEL